uniref:Uncharacterized protein n=1 Tax=Noctiluca scintillans TaxID=2966 RepID=A0A7S1FCL9_NOCSC|eukprot:CAMPEP_0194478516 /NCGR_PEP_ID=MMETSP0253-20130528/1936_1 /TAXON_ID=2966 /ORGANISM="Noctiluca scintillans" /LENGTH=189 /DNA_ID=CAMNT_0039317615 /DNA_START=39 /DNA_END=608 /DNA_ORIENTATION=-
MPRASDSREREPARGRGENDRREARDRDYRREDKRDDRRDDSDRDRREHRDDRRSDFQDRDDRRSDAPTREESRKDSREDRREGGAERNRSSKRSPSRSRSPAQTREPAVGEPVVEVVASTKRANGDCASQAVIHVPGVGGRLRTLRGPPRVVKGDAENDGEEMRKAFVAGGLEKLRKLQMTMRGEAIF